MSRCCKRVYDVLDNSEITRIETESNDEEIVQLGAQYSLSYRV